MRQKHWRLRFWKPCYHGESGMAKRNSRKLQEHGRTGWRSRSSKKHLIVSPMCPRPFGDSGLPCPSDSRETMVERSLFRTQPPPKGWPVLSGGSRNDGLGAGSRITNAMDCSHGLGLIVWLVTSTVIWVSRHHSNTQQKKLYNLAAMRVAQWQTISNAWLSGKTCCSTERTAVVSGIQ